MKKNEKSLPFILWMVYNGINFWYIQRVYRRLRRNESHDILLWGKMRWK